MSVSNKNAMEALRKNNTESALAEGIGILLRLLDNIINFPAEEKYRKVRLENKTIKEKLLVIDGIRPLLADIGFVENEGFFSLPPDVLIARLRNYRDLLQSYLKPSQMEPLPSSSKPAVVPKVVPPAAPKRVEIRASRPFRERTTFPKVLQTQSRFLTNLEDLSDQVMQYEDEQLQESGRKLIPVSRLETRATEKLRRIQKEIRAGSCAGPEPCLRDLLVVELAEWFKAEFFTWVNNAPCSTCGREDTRRFGDSSDAGVRVEEYFCCNRVIKFYRFNDVAQLLQTRRGRCGEWANCFTFLCRCLGYEARWIYTTVDHVWTEVYSDFQQRWIHVDPSDNVVDAPLMYEHGWKKEFSYVFAFAKDDVQDVTWRYSSDHKAVLRRRTMCSEKELLKTILTLRKKRQGTMTPLRYKFVQRRTLFELAEFITERAPTEDEKRGRSSGSLAWRLGRGETSLNHFYVFELSEAERRAKKFVLAYSAALDCYERPDSGVERMKGWASGTYLAENVFRKLEHDWKMVYLARTEGTSVAKINWKFKFGEMRVKDVVLRLETKTYEDGQIEINFLDKNGAKVTKEVLAGHSEFTLCVQMSKGKGDVAWQHTQLFRQSKDAKDFPFELIVTFQ